MDGRRTDIARTLDAVATGEALLGGRIDGEIASEKLLLWRVADPEHVAAITNAFRGAALYMADGHHRYETAAAYAAERRAAEPDAPDDAPFERCLVYLTAADDPGITILPTHRLVRPGPGIAFSLDDLWARLDDAYETLPAADGRAALAAAASMHDDAPCICSRRSRRGGRCSGAHGVPTARRATGSTLPCLKPRCSVPLECRAT